MEMKTRKMRMVNGEMGMKNKMKMEMEIDLFTHGTP